jgi:hypothetical protein
VFLVRGRFLSKIAAAALPYIAKTAGARIVPRTVL